MRRMNVTAATILLAVCGGLLAQDATTQPATQPTTQPAKEVLYTVGEAKITLTQVNKILGPLVMSASPQQIAEARENLVKDLVYDALISQFLDMMDVKVTDEAIATRKQAILQDAAAQAKKLDMTLEQFLAMQNVTDKELTEAIRMSMRQDKLIEREITSEKIDAYLKAHPHYFDGTKVTARHILIKCEPITPTAQQEKIVERLDKIAGLIAEKKITFADAAKRYSQGPSAENGGDLGAFEFASMVTPFAEKAFEMKVGEVSKPVRTKFGYHLILVTAREEGDGKPGENAREQAGHALASRVINKMLTCVMDECKIAEK